MNHSTPGLPVHHQLLVFTQTHIHRGSNAIQPSYPLSSPSPPAPNPSQHQSFPMSQLFRMRWPKYWSFSFSIIPSKEIPGLISFRMDWLDLLTEMCVFGVFKYVRNSSCCFHTTIRNVRGFSLSCTQNSLRREFGKGSLFWSCLQAQQRGSRERQGR